MVPSGSSLRLLLFYTKSIICLFKLEVNYILRFSLINETITIYLNEVINVRQIFLNIFDLFHQIDCK